MAARKKLGRAGFRRAERKSEVARARAARPARKSSASKRAPGAGAAGVDEYLSTLPADARAVLAKLRRTIRAAAPRATEGISYRIPTFRHHGQLVGFAAFPGHCTFFVMSTEVTQKYAAALRRYPVGKGSIRFPADQPLPVALVTKLVRARIAENEALAQG